MTEGLLSSGGLSDSALQDLITQLVFFSENLHQLSCIQHKIFPILEEEFLNTVIPFLFVGCGQL